MDKISSRSWLGMMPRRWHLSWINLIIVSILIRSSHSMKTEGNQALIWRVKRLVGTTTLLGTTTALLMEISRVLATFHQIRILTWIVIIITHSVTLALSMKNITNFRHWGTEAKLIQVPQSDKWRTHTLLWTSKNFKSSLSTKWAMKINNSTNKTAQMATPKCKQSRITTAQDLDRRYLSL